MARKNGTGSTRTDGSARALKRGPGGGRSDTKVVSRTQASAIGPSGRSGGKVPRKFQTTK